MANVYYTSQDIIDSVKRKMMLPTSQNTFNDSEILAFANEEMHISQVPAVMQYHEEYFVFLKRLQLLPNVSRYPIPTRAIGMRLRNIKWADTNNTLYDMARVNADDKAYFQRNGGATQAVHKYYLENNEIVLTPPLLAIFQGTLNFYYYLRPNNLVFNDRAAIIESFNFRTKLRAAYINIGDTIQIANDIYTAVLSNTHSITSITAGEDTKITCPNHGLVTGQYITLSGTNCGPSIDGTYTVDVVDNNTFIILTPTANNGTTGTVTALSQFVVVPSDSIATATNLVNSINSIGNHSATNGSPISTDTLVITFIDPTTNILAPNNIGFVIDKTQLGITFNSLPNTYTDPITNQTTSLFTVGSTVDFLQTNPGHRTYAIDVQIQSITGNTAYFKYSDLTVYTDSPIVGDVNAISGLVGVTTAPMVPGDYICLANECIIPQIPPDLHPGLVERVCARILTAIGDRDGLNTVNAKIADIEKREGNLLDNRVDGSPKKVLNRNGLLRFGKTSSRRKI